MLLRCRCLDTIKKLHQFYQRVIKNDYPRVSRSAALVSILVSYFKRESPISSGRWNREVQEPARGLPTQEVFSRNSILTRLGIPPVIVGGSNGLKMDGDQIGRAHV